MFGKTMETVERNNITELDCGLAPVLTLKAKAVALRQSLMMLLVFVSSALGVWAMYEILSANGLSYLEGVLLFLFAIMFSWLVMAFWTAAIGFLLKLLAIDPISLKPSLKCTVDQLQRPINGRHAIVMPVYNEDTKRIMAGFEASVKEVCQSGKLANFDFYMLSDTRDAELINAELSAWENLCIRLGTVSQQMYYRRRTHNTSRKVGNLADFCQRWGYLYETMIVLDADSVMTANSMLHLTHAMQANPSTGLIQTIPMPVRQSTFFGRFVQFAAHLYSPMLATGLSFWQTDRANYWGHNAIVRIDAFMQSCGLPLLNGKGPFGGEILSHDFVEAALLRRAGWDVFLLTDVEGSYEEVPSNILEYATRDRRWVQGNIQHLSLLSSKGFSLTNKLHFIFGAFAYISSLLLVLMLALSTIDAVQAATTSPIFFVDQYQLFPVWPIAKSELMQTMLVCTVALLLMPKILGLILALIQRRAKFGGTISLIASFMVELLFAIIIAPLMMMYHAFFVICVLVGHSVRWEAQAREGRMVSWADAWRRTNTVSSIAVVWGATIWVFTPGLLWWMLPILLGLMLAAPIIRYSSSLALGRFCQRQGLLLIQEEIKPHAVLKRVRICLANLQFDAQYVDLSPPLPIEQWRSMPIQQLTKNPEVILLPEAVSR